MDRDYNLLLATVRYETGSLIGKKGSYLVQEASRKAR